MCPSQLLHYYCYCCWHFLHLLSFYLSTPSTFPHIPNKFKLFTPSTCYVGKLGIKLGIKSLLLLLLLLLLHTLHLLSFHLSNVHTLQQLDRHSVTTAAAATTTVASIFIQHFIHYLIPSIYINFFHPSKH